MVVWCWCPPVLPSVNIGLLSSGRIRIGAGGGGRSLSEGVDFGETTQGHISTTMALNKRQTWCQRSQEQ